MTPASSGGLTSSATKFFACQASATVTVVIAESAGGSLAARVFSAMSRMR
jgi:hypothetical protein